MSGTQKPRKTDAPDFEARRRLLRLGAYVPPAILGMMIMGQRSAWADGKGGGGGSCNPHGGASCNPSACNPCITKGGKKKGSFEYNQCNRQCQQAQRKYKMEHGD